jgi:hypothetical protein
MIKKIAVSNGHNPTHPGFKADNISEYSEMALLTGMVVSHIQMAGHIAYLVGTGPLEDKVNAINDLGVDCAIELHLNAGGGHGYETLHCPGSTAGMRLATSINQAIGLVMASRNRGVKEGWYHMDPKNDPDYFLWKTNCPAVINELYFLDNEKERVTYCGSLDILDAVASRITVGILKNLTGDESYV